VAIAGQVLEMYGMGYQKSRDLTKLSISGGTLSKSLRLKDWPQVDMAMHVYQKSRSNEALQKIKKKYGAENPSFEVDTNTKPKGDRSE
jgi:hypothetical protein